jgi:hypothetical protein
MKFPSPSDSANAPVWVNFVEAQLVQASLGRIPAHCLLESAEVFDEVVNVYFGLSVLDERDLADMTRIVADLSSILGGEVQVNLTHGIGESRGFERSVHLRHVFVARRT